MTVHSPALRVSEEEELHARIYGREAEAGSGRARSAEAESAGAGSSTAAGRRLADVAEHHGLVSVEEAARHRGPAVLQLLTPVEDRALVLVAAEMDEDPDELKARIFRHEESAARRTWAGLMDPATDDVEVAEAADLMTEALEADGSLEETARAAAREGRGGSALQQLARAHGLAPA
jgi:hypothetical protein